MKNVIMLNKECEYHKGRKCSTGSKIKCPDVPSCTHSRPMTPAEQHKHHRYIIARANQSVTAPNGFADNSIFFKLVVQEAHTFTDKDGVVWQVS